MPIYRIADLNVLMECGGRTASQAKPYLTAADAKPDIVVAVTEAKMKDARRTAPRLPDGELEYILSATEFYRDLLKYNGFMLHASALLYEGRAFLFSAPSGTGKSTHTERWQSYFGKSKVRILNDDKPAIRHIDKGFYAYGTPWSGKEDKSIPMGVPLAGICFLEQANRNVITRLPSKEALAKLFSQTLRKLNDTNMDRLFKLLALLLCEVPIYRLGCTISDEAVILAEKTMNRHSITPLFEDAPGRQPITLREGYDLKIKAGSNIISCVNDDDFRGLMTLNSTGVFLFRILKTGATREELVKALADEYSVNKKTAANGVDAFLQKLSQLNLISE